MNKLIVGLGNPGEKYQNNRHNVGTMFLDFLLDWYVTRYTLHALPADRQVTRFTPNKYLKSNIATVNNNGVDVILSKPQTYMNESGISVHSCVTRYTLHVTQDLIVVHDDLDIPFGKYKIQFGTGPQLHNGIESIEHHLKTKDFFRVRIGVDNRTPEKHIEGITYVLQDFSDNEKKLLTNTVFPTIYTQLRNSPVNLL